MSDALACTDFTHPEREPVLLVHGTFTEGPEQYLWNYALELGARGFDWCTITYPNRGFGDLQLSGEYVAWAVLAIHGATGRKVDVAGHSQGGLVPRWAIRWWPSATAAVDDFVGVASPNHGGELATLSDLGTPPTGLPPFVWQVHPDSNFLAVLNADDETPGDIDYTQVYTLTDELIQPVVPVPTAALDWQQDNARVANLLLQELCPLRVVDHLTIGTTDRVAFELVVDAFIHKGPADPARLDLDVTCNLPDQVLDPAAQLQAFFALGPGFLASFPPELVLVDEEPPIRGYALAGAGGGTTAEQPVSGPSPTGETGEGLPASGGGLALGGLSMLALLAASFGSGRRT